VFIPITSGFAAATPATAATIITPKSPVTNNRFHRFILPTSLGFVLDGHQVVHPPGSFGVPDKTRHLFEQDTTEERGVTLH
jgi:hypothetical protein